MKFVEKYFGKDALKVSAKDIEVFVKKKIEENSTLDYKDIAILGTVNLAGGGPHLILDHHPLTLQHLRLHLSTGCPISK